MKIIYTTNLNQTSKGDLRIFDRLKNYGYQFTVIDWKEELGTSYSPSREEIDKLYSGRDENLISLYKKIQNLSTSHDVFLATQTHVYHPRFIDLLSGIYKVFWSGDDPAISDDCSRPYVSHYDHMFAAGVNFDESTKITEKFLEWGAKRADWWPLGFRDDDYNPNLTIEDIKQKERDIDLVFVGNIWNKKRRDILIKLKRVFPQMKMFSRSFRYLKKRILINLYFTAYTRTWCRGEYLPRDQFIPLYQHTKIGINIHSTFGPSTIRTYQLPANGVMQICDCPYGLDHVFKVGKEVVLYHSIDELVELIQYYLENDEERKKIASEGFKKAIKDYHREATFLKALKEIKKGIEDKN